MKENLSPKEQKIKSILSNIHIDIDTQDLWNEIEDALPSQTKKRAFPLFGLSALFLLVSLSLSIFFLNRDTIAAEQGQSLSSTTQTSESETNESETNESETNESETRESPLSAKTESPLKLKAAKTTSSIPAVARAIQITKPTTIDIKKTIALANTNVKTYNSIKSVSTNIITDQIIAVTKKPAATTPVSNTASHHITKPKHSTSIASSNISLATKNESILRSKLTVPNSLPLPVITGFTIDTRALDNKTTFVDIVQENNWEHAFVLRFGINRSYSQQEIINKNTEFAPAAFDLEQGRYGLSSDFIYKLENKNSWAIGLGISYAKLTTQYRDQSLKNISADQNGSEINIDPNGLSTSFETTVVKQGQIENDILWHRHHSSINASIYLSKKMLRNHRINIEPEISLGTNLTTQHQGYFFDERDGFTKMDSNSPNPYEKNTGLNAQLACLVSSTFGSFQLGILPYLRYNPQSITNTNHYYSLKNSQYGLQISVAYQPN